MNNGIKEKVMKEAENFVFEEYNVAEDNTEYQYYINENNWLSKCIIEKAIQLTEQEKNREFSEFLANTSIIANDISKLSLMIMETINDKDDFEKLQHIANLISGINNSLQSFADLIGEKIKELESKK